MTRKIRQIFFLSRISQNSQHFAIACQHFNFLKQGIQTISTQPTHGSLCLALPLYFFAKQIQVIHLFKIVVFRSHPKHRHKVFVRIFLRINARRRNCRNNFINEVSRSAKQTQLMTSSHGKCVFIQQRGYTFNDRRIARQ